MRIIVLLALLLPLAAHAQVMRCPDGSYRDSCAGGETYEPGDVSGYTAPRSHQQPLAPVQRQQQAPSRQQSQPSRSRAEAPPPSLMQMRDRARDMGITHQELMRARNSGEVLKRMHRQDVEYILGNPTRVNQETIGGQLCHHLHWWKRNRWAHYVRLCNGRVDHISHRNI